ncbi:MAG: hypothetical protein KJ811_00430, partial [Candidatus Margulisbacteria bacterium]|nr:hypothetical protein [Candidatus Margulisiibacteriota bacterium]
MIKRLKKILTPFFLYLSLVLVFFSRFLDGSLIFGFKDLSRYFYPLRYLMVEQVKAGFWPLWNPYNFCGFPLLATLQIGFFYPLTIIYYILPFNLAFNYFIILHYFLSASFMYLLLRHYRLERISSFLGGFVFAFSGYLLSVSNMNTSLNAVTWLPLVVLFFDRLTKKFNFVNISCLAGLLALEFLGGEPTIVYLTSFLLFFYGLVFAKDYRGVFRNMAGLGLAALLALGLLAIQLVPFFELAGFSDRVVKNTYEIVTMRSFPPREIVTFLFPYFFGSQVGATAYSEAFLGEINQDWLISTYLGIIPIILVFLAFVRRERKRLYFFAGVAIISLLLSFGKYTPLYKLIYLIPGASLIRYPIKYLFLT